MRNVPSDACRAMTPPLAVGLDPRLHLAAFVRAAPRPRVAKPQRRQQVQRRRLRPAIGDRDADQHIVRRRLGVLGRARRSSGSSSNTPVSASSNSGSPLPRRRFSSTSRAYGILGLRILVERLHVRMRRRRIEVVVALLHVLAVVALRAGQAEQPLLQDRVAAVPQRQREAQPALAIADAQQPVFAPAIRAAAGLIVRRSNPSTRRAPNSPRGPCPIAARTDTVPTAASWPCGRATAASRSSSAVSTSAPSDVMSVATRAAGRFLMRMAMVGNLGEI